MRLFTLRLVFGPAAALLLLIGCGQPSAGTAPTASAAASTTASTIAVATTVTATATVQPTAAPTLAPTVTTAPAPSPAATAVPTVAPTPTTAPATPTAAVDAAAVARGKALFASAGCALCHTIQGVSTGNQCPDLTHIATAPIPSPPWDKLPNDPAFLQRWIKNPQAIKPGNLMPDLGLTDQQVSDVVAFLETQR